MNIFRKTKQDWVSQADHYYLYHRIRALEAKIEQLQREAVYIQGETGDERVFRSQDARPHIKLKTIVLALARHMKMEIGVEPAKPPDVKLMHLPD